VTGNCSCISGILSIHGHNKISGIFLDSAAGPVGITHRGVGYKVGHCQALIPKSHRIPTNMDVGSAGNAGAVSGLPPCEIRPTGRWVVQKMQEHFSARPSVDIKAPSDRMGLFF